MASEGKKIRIALAQFNPTVGAIEDNVSNILDFVQKAIDHEADIIAFPELAITGYPPEDLLLNMDFVEDNLVALRRLAKCVVGITAIVGYVNSENRNIYNAAALINNGRVVYSYHKCLLPNYGVFDEKRYFQPGYEAVVIRLGQFPIGMTICEDIWLEQGPYVEEIAAGARLIISINASPYHFGKVKIREQLLSNIATKYKVYLAYVNMVGGQDELVFDGNSMVVNEKGMLIAKAPAFQEHLLICDICNTKKQVYKSKSESVQKIYKIKEIELEDAIPLRQKKQIRTKIYPYLESSEEIYGALLLGLSDYVRKNSFSKVVVGLSGGIDSALVATIATDALGKEQVKGVFMPSPYTSLESGEDVRELVKNLGIELIEIPITEIFITYLRVLEPIFYGKKRDVTEENIQARIRGNLLMALSNKFGWLVLTTGNKSELSVGYATLYGDMAGGFAVIKDVPKTMVYELARFRNRKEKVIPDRILTKEPSAELRPNQKDRDTLPPYEFLDKVLKAYVEDQQRFQEIASDLKDFDTVKKILEMIDKNEYKRRQAPPGIKITPRAFGKDRRMPITNRYLLPFF